MDLVIELENEKGSIIGELRVESRVESDHLPVEMHIGRKSAKKREKKMGERKNLG